MLADGLILFVTAVCKICYWTLIIRIVLSWVNVSPWTHGHEIVNIIYQVTDVLLKPFQRLPLHVGPLDLSPILVIVVLNIIPRLVAALLYNLLGLIR